MTISREQVLHVAKLANLALAEDEVERLRRDLEDILAHVAQLAELDTREIPVTAHMAVDRLPLVADECAPSLDAMTVQAEAPRVVESSFAVPAFMEE